MSAEKQAQQRFLIEASERLLATAPTISSRLGAEHIRVNDGARHQYDTPTCLACGIILIPGWSCRKVSKGMSNHDTTLSPRFYECDKCGTRTIIRPSRKTSIKNQRMRPSLSTIHPKSQQSTPDSISTPSQTQELTAIRSRAPAEEIAHEPTPSSVVEPAISSPAAQPPNTASKKRARARKQGGLQALLAQRKTEGTAQAGSVGGLDLMDFMKSV